MKAISALACVRATRLKAMQIQESAISARSRGDGPVLWRRFALPQIPESGRLRLARIAKVAAFQSVELPVGSPEPEAVAVAHDDAGRGIAHFDYVSVEHVVVSRDGRRNKQSRCSSAGAAAFGGCHEKTEIGKRHRHSPSELTKTFRGALALCSRRKLLDQIPRPEKIRHRHLDRGAGEGQCVCKNKNELIVRAV